LRTRRRLSRRCTHGVFFVFGDIKIQIGKNRTGMDCETHKSSNQQSFFVFVFIDKYNFARPMVRTEEICKKVLNIKNKTIKEKKRKTQKNI
jgi:hypothetical protein